MPIEPDPNSMFRFMRRWLFAMLMIAAVTSLGGCRLHEVRLRPDPTVSGPTAFSIGSTMPAATGESWWITFTDPKLNDLIDKALTHNLTLQQAVARLDQARSLTRRAGSLRLPQVRIVADRVTEWRDGDQEDPVTRVGGAMRWEVDVFNRLGAAAMARQNEEAAFASAVDTVRLGLSAAVAEAYFDAVEQRLQLALLKRQVEVDRDLLELTELRFQSGLTASVDVLQQSSQLAETESLVPPAQAALRVAENRLDVLIGQAPDALNRVTGEDRFGAVTSLPFMGVPSDLLLNRPDLRALRSDLVAADAQIAQAIADRLPRLVLDGSLAYEDGPTLTGAAGTLLGTLVQPLLDWGNRKAEVARNQALYRERLAAFTQAYLQAIEDVENTLYQERKQRLFLDRLERRRQLLARTVDETRDRYTNGLTDFLPVLDAITQLQRLERVIVRQQRDLLGFRIQLHRALGGQVNAKPTEG